MKLRYSCVFLFLFFVLIKGYSQLIKHKELEQFISLQNDSLHYEESIVYLEKIIKNPGSNYYDKYFAYLLKSYTYKRLLDYELAQENINLALHEGLKSNRKQQVIAQIQAEKALIQFDLRNYGEAKILIDNIKANNYRYIDETTKAFIIMQEGYINMFDGYYEKADSCYNSAIAILEEYEPKHLPNIYGKKMELYMKEKNDDKMLAALDKGLSYAKKYNVIKYQIYLYEILLQSYGRKGSPTEVFQYQASLDSLKEIYDESGNIGRLGLVEKEFYPEKQPVGINIWAYISIVGITVIVIMGRLYRKKQKRKASLMEEELQLIDILSQETTEKSDAFLSLSAKQLDIVRLVKEGRTNKEIGKALHISENTVKYHLKVIYKAVGVTKRGHL